MALYKRPDSKFWWMKFQFDGEIVQQSTKCSNKRDAGTVESAYRTQLALGKIGIEPKKEIPNFETAVEDFLKWSKVEHALQTATYKRYYFSCQTLKNRACSSILLMFGQDRRQSRTSSTSILNPGVYKVPFFLFSFENLWLIFSRQRRVR